MKRKGVLNTGKTVFVLLLKK